MNHDCSGYISSPWQLSKLLHATGTVKFSSVDMNDAVWETYKALLLGTTPDVTDLESVPSLESLVARGQRMMADALTL